MMYMYFNTKLPSKELYREIYMQLTALLSNTRRLPPANPIILKSRSQVISDMIIHSWGCTVFVSLTVALITTDTSLQSTSRFVHLYYNFSQYFYVWYYRSQQLQRYLHVSFMIMLNGNYSYLFLVSSSHDGCISSQTHLEEWILSTICYHRLSILLFVSFLLLLIWVIN